MLKLLSILTAILICALPATVGATVTQVSGNGGYTWHTHPIATEKTDLFFTSISNQGNARAFLNSSSSYFTGNSFAEDDHNAPAVLAVPDKENLYFGTRHDNDDYMRFRKTSSGGINFGSETLLEFPGHLTYAQVWNYGDTVFLLTRVDSQNWYVMYSEDWGDNWSEPIHLFDYDSQVYMMTKPFESDPSKLHLVVAPHPTESNSKDIWYGTLDMDSGDVSDFSGVQGNVFSGTGLPLVYSDLDGLGVQQGSTQRFRMLDVGDKYGKTVVYYAKWQHSTAQPDYYYAVQNSSDGSWARTNTGIEAPIFAYSGAGNYVGGMSLDKNGDDHIWISQKGAGGTWSINKYPINSNMTLGTREIITTSSDPLVRPYAVFNSDKVIYQHLDAYNSYNDYNIYVKLITP